MAEEGVPPVEQIATELEESKVELEFVEEFWKELKVETAQARAAKEELEDQLRTATQQLKDAKAEQQFVLEEMETARKQVAAKEAELKAAQEAAATAAGKWHELELPMYPPVVRKEIREMSLAEQERYANAVDKMMESEDGVPGSSQFFRLASYHGGPKTEMWNPEGEYCVHGFEAFPGWHRAYLLEFERCMRRADIALGGDGRIGLPYWGWEESYTNNECFPRILRDRFESYPADMFPDGIDGAAHSRGDRGLVVKSDRTIAWKLDKNRVGKEAKRTLNVSQHWQHACTRSGDGRNPSIESPHNSIHGMLGGVMATFQSAFHPVFWLHHNNIDRFYEKYISMPEHHDSHREFETMQARFNRRGEMVKQAGFPEGSYGIYRPFKHPRTGEDFHAQDTFNTVALGYEFDDLPEPASKHSRFMTEMPTYAVFEKIVITEMENSRNLHVFVVSKDEAEGFAVPDDVDSFIEHAAYAGSGTIFGLFPPGGCTACKFRPPFDVSVDITTALREKGLRMADATVVVAVENAADGTVQALADTPVPAPALRGPTFDNIKSKKLDVSTEGDNYAPDVEAMQKFLVSQGYKPNGVVDGAVGDATVASIKAFQEAAGLKVDGIAGPLTKAKVVAPVFDAIPHLPKPDEEDTATFKSGDTVSWSLGDVPGYLNEAAVTAELQTAFDKWAPACGVEFEHAAEGGTVTIGFEGEGEGLHIFDGPGGSLAKALTEADALGIRFDEEEKWLLQTDGDEEAPGYFKLLPVAVHEVGHVLGLSHAKNAADVMGPYYVAARVDPTANDIARCAALYGVEVQ